MKYETPSVGVGILVLKGLLKKRFAKWLLNYD